MDPTLERPAARDETFTPLSAGTALSAEPAVTAVNAAQASDVVLPYKPGLLITDAPVTDYGLAAWAVGTNVESIE